MGNKDFKEGAPVELRGKSGNVDLKKGTQSSFGASKGPGSRFGTKPCKTSIFLKGKNRSLEALEIWILEFLPSNPHWGPFS